MNVHPYPSTEVNNRYWDQAIRYIAILYEISMQQYRKNLFTSHPGIVSLRAFPETNTKFLCVDSIPNKKWNSTIPQIIHKAGMSSVRIQRVYWYVSTHHYIPPCAESSHKFLKLNMKRHHHYPCLQTISIKKNLIESIKPSNHTNWMEYPLDHSSNEKLLTKQ